MKTRFAGWKKVAEHIESLIVAPPLELNPGQIASLRALAFRLSENGVILADEVGMGKTRIATVMARAVIAAGGRVAILAPPGLGYQWQSELQETNITAPPILRSLWQYFKAWEPGNQQQRWYREPVVIISHGFTHWRQGAEGRDKRYALLPEICARWRKREHGRWPNGFSSQRLPEDTWVSQTAEDIVNQLWTSPKRHPAHECIQKLADTTPWPEAFKASGYGRNAKLRASFENATGLGLGAFDLVIIDEAHKSRNNNSGLNQLITQVILNSREARSLALTATPIELSSDQWLQILDRINVSHSSKNSASQAISRYGETVAQIRRTPSDEASFVAFQAAAIAFKSALDPYLLRRGKKDSLPVKMFTETFKQPYYTYRHEQEILISPQDLTPEWRQALCAAEALSFAASNSHDMILKRLRLTVGNGHGIAAVFDNLPPEAGSEPTEGAVTKEPISAAQKQQQRAQWWQQVLLQPWRDNKEWALFSHPAILAAVTEIETVCLQGENVLVFGRFTRPLRALTQLLNAREMLRSLDNGIPWPQAKVHGDDEWNALCCAHQQLGLSWELKRDSLNHRLDTQYQALSNQRRVLRNRLINNIEDEFAGNKPHKSVLKLFEAFKRQVAAGVKKEANQADIPVLVLVARALQEFTGLQYKSATAHQFAQAFVDLVMAASHHHKDAGTDYDTLWENIVFDLNALYRRPEGGFARFMYGETAQTTRRLLQLAFNRPFGNPRVLVTQSEVGREGLNLHEACRTVILLHPEWNPGVVEQQIGRVDRIGSLWEQKLNQAIHRKVTGMPAPTINIRPVIFQGTYDEQNWQVLRARWDDLRAQLQGVVISPRMANLYRDKPELVERINQLTPNFSPELTLSNAPKKRKKTGGR